MELQPLFELQNSQSMIEEFAAASCAVVVGHIATHNNQKRKANVMHMPFPLRKDITFDGIAAILNERCFKRAFRVSRDSFYRLLDYVKPSISKDTSMGTRSGRTTVPADIRLGITLRMLAGASYLDVMMCFRVGASTVYDIFHDTCLELMKVMKLPGLPTSFQGLHKLSQSFKYSRSSPSPFSGCIGALDGISVRIRKPARYLNPAAFYCRKGFYALPVQALVDGSYRFLSYSARCVGSTHDALAHAVSSLGKFLEKHGLRSEFWIVGDEAYVCTESLITPIPLSQLVGPYEDAFNFYLSSLRIHVEQAFGMLVARWRILQNTLQYSVYISARIICLCMKLHNFCLENGEQTVTRLRQEEKVQCEIEIQHWYACCKEDNNMQVLQHNHGRTQGVSRKREELVSIIRQKELRRPSLYGVPQDERE